MYQAQVEAFSKYAGRQRHGPEQDSEQDSEHGHAYAMRLKEEAERNPLGDPKKRHVMLTSLQNHVVEELQTLIYDEVHRDCEGCQVDHPSQRHHLLCLFTPTDDWVEFYIDSAMKKINLYKVMEQWYPELERMQLTGAEKADAYRMWNDIKWNFEVNQSVEHWRSVYAERVKRAWNHGYH